MLMEYVGTFITEKLINGAFIGIKNVVSRINKNEEILKIKRFSVEDCIEFIGNNIEETSNWAKNISFQGAKAKNLGDIFIDIDLSVVPKKELISRDLEYDTISINDLMVDSGKNIVILGDPGAGKTTSIKKIYLEVIKNELDIYKTFDIPVIIRLKDIQPEDSNNRLVIFNEILKIFGVSISISKKEFTDYDFILKQVFREFIERLNILIILDGFDEISNPELREKIVHNIEVLSNSIVNSRFILTSRSADYNLDIGNTEVYEISPLNKDQVKEFIYKWLKNRKQSDALFAKLQDSPYWDTTLRPLLLAQMCALYEKQGDIPDKPKSIYDKIITLLLEEWSIQNRVKRQSKYANFGTERKKEFISTFAFNLVVLKGQFWFSRNDLRSIYNNICQDFDLPKNRANTVFNEIESHNGLIIQSGIDNYEFSHKSLAEYLVANYLVKLPLLVNDVTKLKKIPNELAILIAISSGANWTYYHLVHDILKESILEKTFLKVFLARLIVEKPDYERANPLYALANIYVLNLISKRVKVIYSRVEEVLKEQYEYYRVCENMLFSMCHKSAFYSSFDCLKYYYEFSDLEDNSSVEYDFTAWREVIKLKRSSSLEYLGNNILLPDLLFIPKDFVKK